MQSFTKQFNQVNERINLLLVGNNPIELDALLGKVKRIPGKKVMTEFAFDLKGLVERLMNFKPNYILIDDNIGKSELTETLKTLAENRRTKDIPVTVLKNSNYEEALGTGSVLDYILKNNVSAESLLHVLKNSLKLKRTQLHLYKAYMLRKKHLIAS